MLTKLAEINVMNNNNVINKISWFNLVFLSLIIAVLFSINNIVDSFYQYYFETTFLPKNPNADFDLMFGQSRLQSDKNFLFGLWIFTLSMLLLVMYQDFRLGKIKEEEIPSRKKMLSVFFIRIIAYAFILVTLPMNLIVFDKSYDSMLSLTDKLILGMMICVMINSMALIPYLAQRNIANFFKLKDIVIFNMGMLITLVILIYLGVSQYVAPAISTAISGFPFISKITAAWKQIDDFFGIKGKQIYEMF